MSKNKKDKKKKLKKASKLKKDIKKEIKKEPKEKSTRSSCHSHNESEHSISQDHQLDEQIGQAEDQTKLIIKFKSSRRGPIQRRQAKQTVHPLVECYDSDDVIEFDATQVSQDPHTIYTAAQQIFSKLSGTQKNIETVHKKSQDLLKQLDYFCKAQLALLNQQVASMRDEIKSEMQTDSNLAAPVGQIIQEAQFSIENVQNYLTRFELINSQLKQLQPLMKFRTPKFFVPTDLKVQKHKIASPFGVNGPIGAAIRFVSKLQSKDIDEIGLCAINTPEHTCIGRIDVIDQNGQKVKTEQDQNIIDIDECSQNYRLEFTLRKALCKRYDTAICHGSRLICDADVYNKNYELMQNLYAIPRLTNDIHALCNYDKEFLLAGLSHYYLAILKFNHEAQQYSLFKTIRLQKAQNIEGNVLHIERVNHMPGWYMCITFRSFRVFKVVYEQNSEDENKVKLRLPVDCRKVLRDTISIGFLKVQQHAGNIIMMSMGAVTLIKINTANGDVHIQHSIRVVRTDRIGLFPGFCSENFPFIIAQVGDFNGREFLAQKDINYLGWVSHHLGMQSESQIESDIGVFRPQIYEFKSKSLLGIDDEGQLAQLTQTLQQK